MQEGIEFGKVESIKINKIDVDPEIQVLSQQWKKFRINPVYFTVPSKISGIGVAAISGSGSE